MPFVETSELTVKEPLPGWKGCRFNSESIAFGYYPVAAGASIHEHEHPNEAVSHVEDELSPSAVRPRPPGRDRWPSCRQTRRHSVRALTDGRAIVVDHPLRRSLGGVSTAWGLTMLDRFRRLAVSIVCGLSLLPATLGSAHDHPAATSESQPPFYAEMATADATMHHDMTIVPSGDVDRDFLRMMIPHHQGAIDMALVVLKYGRDERVKRLALSIIVQQGEEITYMRTLLDGPPATK